MTTGELIRRLQAADPSGELPVCVGNCDVYFVETLPAYYDGRLQQLVHDKSLEPNWTIVGARITSQGMKVNLRDLSIRDVLNDMPDLPIEVIGSGPTPEEIEAWRSEAREI